MATMEKVFKLFLVFLMHRRFLGAQILLSCASFLALTADFQLGLIGGCCGANWSHHFLVVVEFIVCIHWNISGDITNHCTIQLAYGLSVVPTRGEDVEVSR